jgi:uncharacterized protein (TIGR00251 family)
MTSVGSILPSNFFAFPPAFLHNPSMANSPPTPGFLRAVPGGLLLSVKLQPRASANEIGEPLGNELRIKVTAPPVDAAANEALLRLLAERLDCPRSCVELIRGQTSRHKVIKLHNFDVATAMSRLVPPKK